jgi:hypothetical protein
MRLRAICWAMGLGLLSCGFAQAQAQTPAAYAGTPTPERITAWLKSGSAQDRAWGAHFIVVTRDASFLPTLEALAEQWEVLPPHSSQLTSPYKLDPKLEPEQVDRQDAMTAVLDAVILLGGQVSAQGLQKLQVDFPAQSAVLLARLSPRDAEPTLLVMYHNTDPQHWKQRRVAAELLALNPPAGFAASIMKDSEIKISVKVVIPDQREGGMGHSSSCGGGFLRPPDDPNWPVVGQYALWDHFTNPTIQRFIPLLAATPLSMPEELRRRGRGRNVNADYLLRLRHRFAYRS